MSSILRAAQRELNRHSWGLSLAKIQNAFEMNNMWRGPVTLLRGPDLRPAGVLANECVQKKADMFSRR
jgi:hypothetical protein